MTTVLVVGLGTIARTHLAVLDRLPGVEVVAGVDPARPEQPFPVHATLADAADVRPDLVVVATPTDTHVPLVTEALGLTDGLVLSEKPLARTTAALAGLDADRVRVAHHFAFSPEVEWARAYVEARPALGPPRRVQSVFNDAYGALPDAQRASLVASWVDSAPNQLSVVSAFVSDLDLRSHAARTERAATVLDHAGGTTYLTSNWLAADSSKQTTLEWDDLRIWMDHTSMTVVVTEEGRVAEHVAYADDVSRKDAHYLGLYDALLHRPEDPRLGVPLAREVARLLEEAAGLPAVDVGWREVATRRPDRAG